MLYRALLHCVLHSSFFWFFFTTLFHSCLIYLEQCHCLLAPSPSPPLQFDRTLFSGLYMEHFEWLCVNLIRSCDWHPIKCLCIVYIPIKRQHHTYAQRYIHYSGVSKCVCALVAASMHTMCGVYVSLYVHYITLSTPFNLTHVIKSKISLQSRTHASQPPRKYLQ